jgi:hypothetical protein
MGSVASGSAENVNTGQRACCEERHYSVGEVAEMWNLSTDVIRKIFEREPGVLVLGNGGSRRKRGYHTLRIPASVLDRVHRRMCNPDLTGTRSRAYSLNKSGPPVAVNN